MECVNMCTEGISEKHSKMDDFDIYNNCQYTNPKQYFISTKATSKKHSKIKNLDITTANNLHKSCDHQENTFSVD